MAMCVIERKPCCCQPSEGMPCRAAEELRKDAERWRAFCARLSARPTPMRGQWRVVEVSPTYGDENEVSDLQRQIDEYATARDQRVGAA